MTVQIIPLKGKVPAAGPIEFLSVSTSSTATGLGVVHYKDEGKRQAQGLRIDLDKGVFLDHFEDKEKEEALVNSATAITTVVFTHVSKAK